MIGVEKVREVLMKYAVAIVAPDLSLILQRIDHLERVDDRVKAALQDHYPHGPWCRICGGNSAKVQPLCPHETRNCFSCTAQTWPCETFLFLNGMQDKEIYEGPDKYQPTPPSRVQTTQASSR